MNDRNQFKAPTRLARLQLGRAHALSRDVVKAKAEYQEFLELRKHADPDIPLLKQAKAEYLRLRQRFSPGWFY